MNKAQISFLAVLFSLLGLVLPVRIFILMSLAVGPSLLWFMHKAIKKGVKVYEPYVYLTLTSVSVLFGIFLFYFPTMSIFNSIFFSFTSMISLKNKNILLKNSQKEVRKGTVDAFEKVRHVQNDEKKESETVSNSAHVKPSVDYDRIMNNLSHEIRENVGRELNIRTNQMLKQFDTRKLLKEQEVLLEEVKQSLSKELSLNLNKAMEKHSTVVDQDIRNSLKHELQKQIETELQNKYHKEISSTKSLISDLKVAMSQHGKTVEDVIKRVAIINEQSPAQTNKEVYEEIIRKLQEERLNFSNNRHIVNHEIKDMLHHALDNSEEEVCIISPWLGKWILLGGNELMNRFSSLLKRGVRLKIAYGISNHSYQKQDDRNANTEKVAEELQRKFRKHGDLFQLRKVNTHHKLLICDNSYYVQGSYNLLSNKGKFEDPTMWHEGAEYSEDPIMINKLKEIYFTWDK
ncbi:hypothetical protein M1I95_08160 [Rossellomorea marisflavi]|uniref:phospholipase D-like domain-containing protein n=1 Tax=Rossellomorea marisflavi TaxID=189381 RepID=UPI0027A943D5|nr:phospholipase D-like domain-containing protein [Rossellomorea marisflavi]UTE74414.1 hypothetical protein M1I95_08160 [Rossellomorea marisflavi]